MEDQRGRHRGGSDGGDAAQQKTRRPECEEPRPLSVEVRLLARGCRACPSPVPVPVPSGARERRSGGKFRVRMRRQHSVRAGARPVPISPAALIG